MGQIGGPQSSQAFEVAGAQACEAVVAQVQGGDFPKVGPGDVPAGSRAAHLHNGRPHLVAAVADAAFGRGGLAGSEDRQERITDNQTRQSNGPIAFGTPFPLPMLTERSDKNHFSNGS